MKAKKRKSKGMRKHIRYQKAQQRKNELNEQKKTGKIPLNCPIIIIFPGVSKARITGNVPIAAQGNIMSRKKQSTCNKATEKFLNAKIAKNIIDLDKIKKDQHKKPAKGFFLLILKLFIAKCCQLFCYDHLKIL